MCVCVCVCVCVSARSIRGLEEAGRVGPLLFVCVRVCVCACTCVGVYLCFNVEYLCMLMSRATQNEHVDRAGPSVLAGVCVCVCIYVFVCTFVLTFSSNATRKCRGRRRRRETDSLDSH